MSSNKVPKTIMMITILFIIFGINISAIELKPSKLNLEYEILNFDNNRLVLTDNFGDDAKRLSTDKSINKNSYLKKSPTKAFLMSLVVPGLGQYYIGQKKKAIVYAGADLVSWLLYFKWDGQGNDLTDQYEAFSQAHWSRSTYIDYLWFAEGDSSDYKINKKIFTHHLPSTNTQQYYEMTGKYDQFAWGWDDASLYGAGLYEHILNNNTDISVADSVPYSANRFTYENMRLKANNKYDDARKMLMISVFNRVISSVAAFITTKNRNKYADSPDSEFSFNLKADLKSVYSKYDTPHLKLRYLF